MLTALDRALSAVLRDTGWPIELDPLLLRLFNAIQEGHTAVAVDTAQSSQLAALSHLVGSAPGEGLLTLHDGWLSLERHAAQEARIARWFRDRTSITTAMPAADVAGIMPSADQSQQEAIRHTLTHPCSIILGGPGTGKTTTAAAMIVAQLLAFPDRGRDIQLLAPTGKAAVRLTSSLTKALQTIALTPALLSRLPKAARTIHSQLRRLSNASLVVVDEASMISVDLMDALLRQISPSATVIFLGDPNQLASVEAGYVLGVLAAHPAIASLRVTLNRRHRIDGNTTLSAMQDQLQAGDAAGFLRSLESHQGLIHPSEKKRIHARLFAGYRPYFEAWARGDDPLECGFQCLAAIQAGPFGVDALNTAVVGIAQRFGLHGRGHRILVTENQMGLALYNGDIGVMIDPDVTLQRRVSFDDHRDPIDLRQLSRPRSAFALSIHRSQGSEYENVLISIPDSSQLKHAIVTREMLFTALTRAKQQVELIAYPEDIERAIAARTVRHTGLGGHLQMTHLSGKSRTLQ